MQQAMSRANEMFYQILRTKFLRVNESIRWRRPSETHEDKLPISLSAVQFRLPYHAKRKVTLHILILITPIGNDDNLPYMTLGSIVV